MNTFFDDKGRSRYIGLWFGPMNWLHFASYSYDNIVILVS